MSDLQGVLNKNMHQAIRTSGGHVNIVVNII